MKFTSFYIRSIVAALLLALFATPTLANTPGLVTQLPGGNSTEARAVADFINAFVAFEQQAATLEKQATWTDGDVEAFQRQAEKLKQEASNVAEHIGHKLREIANAGQDTKQIDTQIIEELRNSTGLGKVERIISQSGGAVSTLRNFREQIKELGLDIDARTRVIPDVDVKTTKAARPGNSNTQRPSLSSPSRIKCSLAAVGAILAALARCDKCKQSVSKALDMFSCS
jgi:hypothetical protein